MLNRPLQLYFSQRPSAHAHHPLSTSRLARCSRTHDRSQVRVRSMHDATCEPHVRCGRAEACATRVYGAHPIQTPIHDSSAYQIGESWRTAVSHQRDSLDSAHRTTAQIRDRPSRIAPKPLASRLPHAHISSDSLHTYPPLHPFPTSTGQLRG